MTHKVKTRRWGTAPAVGGGGGCAADPGLNGREEVRGRRCLVQKRTASIVLLTRNIFRMWRQWANSVARRNEVIARTVARRLKNTASLFDNYFRKWMFFIQRTRVMLRLRSMQVNTVAILARRCYYRLQKRRNVSRALRGCRTISRTAETALCRHSIVRWHNFLLRVAVANISLPTLRGIAECAEVSLSCRVFTQWKKYVILQKKRLLAMELVESRAVGLLLTRYFLEWKRRRRWSRVIAWVSHNGRKVQRAIGVNYFRKWTRHGARLSLASALAQKNYQCTAELHYRKLIIHTKWMLLLRDIAFSAAENCTRKYLLLWYRWVIRGLEAYQLEQRHAVLLQQRYFLRWKRSVVDDPMLSYCSSATVSRSSSAVLMPMNKDGQSYYQHQQFN